MFANAAELPGLLAAALLLDRCGRKRTISGFFLASGVLVLFLAIPSVYRSLGVVVVFLARACALAFNQSLWVTTSEIYPTNVRATGLGFTTAFARVGGISTAVTSSVLFEQNRFLCLGLSAAGCVIAAALVSCLPVDTATSRMSDRIIVRQYNR